MTEFKEKFQGFDDDAETTTDDDTASFERQASSSVSGHTSCDGLDQTSCDCLGCIAMYQQQVQKIAAETRDHFGALACVVAIESPYWPCGCKQTRVEGLQIVACDGSVDFANVQRAGNSEKKFRFFHYNIRRKLPIIIDDATADERLEDHPLVNKAVDPVRFYATAPVVLTKEFVAYVGAVTIIDSKPRHTFSMLDSETLMQKATDVASVLRALDAYGCLECSPQCSTFLF